MDNLGIVYVTYRIVILHGKYLVANSYQLVSFINPSAWSDGHCAHTVNITCRGVTGTARMLHALTHSSISRQVREQM